MKMRKSIAAYGIIKHKFDGKEFYLLQLNTSWNNRYNFISGHMDPCDDNDFSKTMIRETEEELPPIQYSRDFEVAPVSDQPFKDTSYSLSAATMTDYTFYMFHIRFLVPATHVAFLWENNDTLNKWFTEDELRSGNGKSGERITHFPVPQIMKFIPGGLKSLPDSFQDE